MSVGTTSHFIDEQGIDGDKVRGERRRQATFTPRLVRAGGSPNSDNTQRYSFWVTTCQLVMCSQARLNRSGLA